jgi:hypothetical protein
MRILQMVLLLAFSTQSLSCGTAESTCARATQCGGCLATPGCNWTGETCRDDCLQDVACFGPGNPAATRCP